jgi:ribosomal protein L32
MARRRTPDEDHDADDDLDPEAPDPSDLDDDLDDTPTTECPNCGREILYDTVACPYCGEYPEREVKHTPWWVWFGVVLALAGAVGGYMLCR